MLEIKSETLKSTVFIFVGSLLAAAFIGYSLLKFYEEFQKGVKQKSRVRIWSAFFGLSFVVIVFITILTRATK